MGALVGTFFGAYAQNHIYLTVTYSDDVGGAVQASVNINGTTGQLTGHQVIGSPTTAVTLTGSVGGNYETWLFNTTDFRYLNGTRNLTEPTGASSVLSYQLGRI